MSGKRLFSYREGDRSEYLANFLLSAIGLVTPVPRQEDIGCDFYCALSEREKGVLTFGFPFIVQVKSAGNPIVHLKKPKKYKHQPGVIPDHINWLFRQELPMFLAVIDKKRLSIQLFSLATVWFIFYAGGHCGNCSALRLIPRTKKTKGHVGVPVLHKQVTKKPASFEYDVDLGLPVAEFSAADLGEKKTLEHEKDRLRFWIAFDLKNLVFFRAQLPHFYWLADADRSHKIPLPAFYYDEMPTDQSYQKHIYSFIGPALIPLAMRYHQDCRSDLIDALKPIFREMPASAIPEEVKKSMPYLFD